MGACDICGLVQTATATPKLAAKPFRRHAPIAACSVLSALSACVACVRAVTAVVLVGPSDSIEGGVKQFTQDLKRQNKVSGREGRGCWGSARVDTSTAGFAT